VFAAWNESGIAERADGVERNTQSGVFDQSAANNFQERRGKLAERELTGSIALRQMFGERFKERDAERPDVGSGKVDGFGCGVGSSERPGGRRLTGGENAVGRKLYVVADGVNVAGLEAGVYQTSLVKKIERFENWREHAVGFVGRKLAFGKQLAEIFVGEFGDDVETRRAVNDAAAVMQDAEKSGMRKTSRSVPALELHIGVGGIVGDEFDGGVGSRIAGAIGRNRGEEHGGVGGDAEKFAEPKAAVRKLSEKMLRCVWHKSTAGPLTGGERRE